MKNYRNRLYTAQLEKVYAQVSDAAQAIMNDEHVDNFYETTAGETVNTINSSVCTNKSQGKCEHGYPYFLTKYFKAVKYDCKKADKTGCASSSADNYSNLDGSQAGGGMTGDYCIQTVSGASLCGTYYNNCMSLLIDVNGMAEPNMAGRDVFAFDITSNGRVADYLSGCSAASTGAAADTCGTRVTNGVDALNRNAAGCLNNVIQAGWKMEY